MATSASHPTLWLGWNVGGTTCSAVIGTEHGTILERVQWPAGTHRGPTAMIDDFFSHAAILRQTRGTIHGVGVSIGGPLDTRRGVVKSPPHLPGWDHVPLAETLTDAMQLPVTVEHDAAACLLAEWLWGEAKQTTHAIYLTCGTGMGAGIMIDRRVLRGPAGQSPEIGHVRLNDHGPTLFGKTGSVEAFCSGTGIGLLAHSMFPDSFEASIDTATLAQSHTNGDHNATQVLTHAAERTGQVCALLSDIFSPQVIILGSLCRYLGPWWLELIRGACQNEALDINAARLRIVPAALADRLQDLSAIAPCIAPASATA